MTERLLSVTLTLSSNKQSECPDQSVEPQSDQGLRCALTEPLNNVDRINLHVQSTLVISNSKGLSGTLRDIRTSIFRIEEKIIRTTTFNKYICNWTLDVSYIENIVGYSR